MSRQIKFVSIPMVFFLIFVFLFPGMQEQKADLVLINGRIHTMDPVLPDATCLAVKGNRIIAVGKDEGVIRSMIADHTRVIDLQEAFVTPGIIDGHVHFNRAGALILDANLMTVADEGGLRNEIKRLVDILEDGEWITEGLWGAYEQWALADAGNGTKVRKNPWRPNRRMIDDITPDNPCFLCRYDEKEWLANSAALKAAGLGNGGLEGLEIGRDGLPTGIVFKPSPAFDRLKQARKPKSKKRLLDENRAALKALREAGIVEIHDISTPDQEDRFRELQGKGELTCRVWARPDLSRAAELKQKGFSMGVNPKTGQKDPWFRYGALKGYIDGIMGSHGALFFDPYADQPQNRGHWRAHTSDDPELKEGNMEKMYAMIQTGLEAGFVPNVHAIGDRGVAEMLDLYERVKKELKSDLRGFRVIHAQVIRPSDFQRFRALGVIAEVNPYHISDDMRWMEERIGAERCRGAYALATLLKNGAMLSFGSDWPGTNAALYQMHPKYLIYSAVTRQTLSGEPELGWFPEERISVEDALRAYTINNAIACFEGDIRGSLTAGKIADITVFDRNLLEIPAAEILKTEVIYTIVDGRIVFHKK